MKSREKRRQKVRTRYLSSVLLSILLVTSLIALLSFSTISQTVSATSGTNLPLNSSFESWSGGVPVSWIKESNVNIFQESSIVEEGSYSVRFDTTSATNAGIYQEISVIAGVAYTWSAWLYSPGTGVQGMGIYINWRNSSGGNISSSPSVYNTLVNTWELVTTGPVKAPANAAIARVAIRGYKDTASPAGYADNAKFSPENVFIKYCMPDLGQHCANWCWVAAAANSIYWYSQHGYLQLIDDPANPIVNDNTYITQTMFHPSYPFPPSPPDNVYRLLHEIATDCLYPGVPENMITIDNTYCQPINDIQYFFGLQEFINEQGAPLKVHEIVDNNILSPVPPEGPDVEYRPPTLVDYQRELENCQDVLLWLASNARHENTENYPYRYEDTDHVVTGVAFSYDNSWILVSDPWTPGSPDNSNDLTHILTPYDNLQVLSADPLVVIYNLKAVQVTKIVFISPAAAPEYGVDVSISPDNQEGLPGQTLTYTVTVTNKGNAADTFDLSVTQDSLGWGASVSPSSVGPIAPGASDNTATLSVTIPKTAQFCQTDNMTVQAVSRGDITKSDNYTVTAHVREFFEKTCMPDLGQHCVNWCWVAAAANSIYWYSQHGYLELIDDPAVLPENDNAYITQMFPAPCGDNIYRLLFEIASDCGHIYCEGVLDNDYFFGLQKFINDQGAPLIVHEIVDPAQVLSVPPADGITVIYRPPTLEDYKRELENCQDVLLWLRYRHTYPETEATDHVVTGVGFSRDNQWIYVSDPWTPGTPMPPDHSNDLTHTLTPYDYLEVKSAPDENLWVIYENNPVQVVKMVYISPTAPTPPVENYIKECMPDLGQHCENWCWTAAAANSIWWYANHGYPELIDNLADPASDNEWIDQWYPCPGCVGYRKLLAVIASYCLGLPPENTFCHPVSNLEYFYGLQAFIDAQGAPLYVHEILNPDKVGMPRPPADGENVVYDNVTFDNYKTELKRCQDVLLQLDFKNFNYMEYTEEALDHIVTGVSFFDGGAGNSWIQVSDPWTPQPWGNGPDHYNDNMHVNRYDNLPVVNNDPLTVLYRYWTPGGDQFAAVEVIKLIYISPKILWTGSATFRLENLYKVSLNKDLQLNTGSKLVVKFYKYDNVTLQANSVIENITPPQSVVENENVPHPRAAERFPWGTVQIARLVLTTDNENEVISEIASFTVHQSHLRDRDKAILKDWGGHPELHDAFRDEDKDILKQWGSAPP